MIIKSLLDLDYYKLLGQQFVFHNFPDAQVEYKFKCRTPNIDLAQYEETILDEILNLSTLSFLEDEVEYLRGLGPFKDDYLDYLKAFKLKGQLIVRRSSVVGELEVEVSGSWVEVILYETLILSIVNEVYFREHQVLSVYAEGIERLNGKISLLNFESNDGRPLSFAELGGRRRFSSAWQDYVVGRLKNVNGFLGTSNVFLARKHNLKAIGTMAHEIFMGAQALFELKDSQRLTLEKWAYEFRNLSCIALSDTVGVNAFLDDFDLYLAKLYDGVRHDSGSPYVWARLVISHYELMGIKPLTKTAVFSDGLNVTTALGIRDSFCHKIKCVFGIGTDLVGDMSLTPIQIVMKMTKCNGKAVAKISDSPGKQMCEDGGYLNKLKEVFEIEENS